MQIERGENEENKDSQNKFVEVNRIDAISSFVIQS